MIARRVALPLLLFPLTARSQPHAMDVIRLEAIRPTLMRTTSGNVRFTVRELRRFGEYAYGVLLPRRPDGEGAIDWVATPYRPRVERGQFDNGVTYVLWRRLAGGWKVEEYAVGPTDVVWIAWQQRYRLPRALFDTGEDP
jgi:hypothetical protein